MKTTNTIDLPVLNEVVIPGKEVSTADEFPPLLNKFQIKALEQQIDRIVKARLEAVLKKATQEAVKDIKTHLDKVLPQLIKNVNNSTFNQDDLMEKQIDRYDL